MSKVEYALRIEPIDMYGAKRILAYAVRLTNPDQDYGYDATDRPLKNLIPQAWLDEKTGEIFGMGTEYRDVHSVDLRTAEDMVKTLRKLERGMAKLSESEGYVNSRDFATYLFRVARVLGIKTFYVRNSRTARDNSGEVWRKAIASGVQYYIDSVCEATGKGELYKYIY